VSALIALLLLVLLSPRAIVRIMSFLFPPMALSRHTSLQIEQPMIWSR